MEHGMSKLYFEDFLPGQSFALGSRTLERDEIIAFAREFDPQPFHLDEAAAADSIFGGLIASGWHTVSIYMRLLADGLLARTASMGAPGVDELRWLKPVRPGDTLTASLIVDSVRPSKSKPQLGFVATRSEVINQHGEIVLTLKAPTMMLRRPVTE